MTIKPVVRAARFALAHVPGLVVAGSKPRREITARGAGVRAQIRARLRTFADAVAYIPHQVMIGNRPPEDLWDIARPWHQRAPQEAPPAGPAGMIVDEWAFYAWLARADTARLVCFDDSWAARITANAGATLATVPSDAVAKAAASGAEPLWAEGDRLIGTLAAGDRADAALAAPVLLENLAAKVTGALALSRLLADVAPDEPVDFLLGCGEEAVGDRYQRGGGNLAKAIGELAGVRTSGGADVKSFCAGPVHALIIAGALVASGVHRRVAVVAGGSLAKLGMKFLGHVAAGYPILEDVLAGVAIDVAADDGRSPVLNLQAAVAHKIGDGAAPHQMAATLSYAPLRALGLHLGEVDRFAVELHNPDITEPAGAGDVPARNYEMIAALAVQEGEIGRAAMPAFVRRHGLQGFSPTQGHIPSAIPYLPHAIAGLTAGGFRRVQLVAKGSLFLGRMTEMADGASILLERNVG